jgi:hypothetical protein
MATDFYTDTEKQDWAGRAALKQRLANRGLKSREVVRARLPQDGRDKIRAKAIAESQGEAGRPVQAASSQAVVAGDGM